MHTLFVTNNFGRLMSFTYGHERLLHIHDSAINYVSYVICDSSFEEEYTQRK